MAKKETATYKRYYQKIENIVRFYKSLIASGDFTEETVFVDGKKQERQKNIEFRDKYIHNNKMRQNILMEIETKDFLEFKRDKRHEYNRYGNKMYVFMIKDLPLIPKGYSENQIVYKDVYVKFEFIKLKNNKQIALIISLHEREKEYYKYKFNR